MSISNSEELTDLLKIQLSNLSSLITEDGYGFVCDQTIQELGWAYPLTTPAKLFWVMKRATRHATYILLIASANKFKYKVVNLQQRFEHFKALIEMMDKEFSDALNAEPTLFMSTNADPNAYKMFGTKIDAGFAYDFAGNDITYDVDRYINFTPTED